MNKELEKYFENVYYLLATHFDKSGAFKNEIIESLKSVCLTGCQMQANKDWGVVAKLIIKHDVDADMFQFNAGIQSALAILSVAEIKE